MNSQIILADVKLTNSEKQGRDGGRRSEERCIILIDKHKLQMLNIKKRNEMENEKKITFSFSFSFLLHCDCDQSLFIF